MRGHRFGIVFVIALLPLVFVCAQSGASTAARPRVPVDRSLPPEPNAIFTGFVNEVKTANWNNALNYCSAKVRVKAAEYDSTEAFFNTVLPVTEITALAKFETRGASYRDNKLIRYDCEIQLKDPNYRYPLRWYLTALRQDMNWVMDFSTKPLEVWMKHAVLISKKINRELEVDPERNRAGLEVHLVPLSAEFTIGRPMLFRLELKNISTETLFYENTAYMVNNPLIIKDASGKTISFLGGDAQTGLSDECIEPSETIVLVERYDVRSQYHIVKPGRYSFQFKGWNLSLSNIVGMNVRDGLLSPVEESVESIRSVLPQGWGLSRRLLDASERSDGQSGDVIAIYLVGRQARKASTETSIAIYLTILLEPPADVNAFLDTISKYDFWGYSHLGTVLVKGNNAEELWPDYREQLIKALGIDVQNKP